MCGRKGANYKPDIRQDSKIGAGGGTRTDDISDLQASMLTKTLCPTILEKSGYFLFPSV